MNGTITHSFIIVKTVKALASCISSTSSPSTHLHFTQVAQVKSSGESGRHEQKHRNQDIADKYLHLIRKKYDYYMKCRTRTLGAAAIIY